MTPRFGFRLFLASSLCAWIAAGVTSTASLAQAQLHSDPNRGLPQGMPPGVDNNTGEDNKDLNPNDALFEAINQGNVERVKEAISRGADIGARNALDQTPLDMSIDLNRNNITFLLLSVRSYAGGRSVADESSVLASSAPRKEHGETTLHMSGRKSVQAQEAVALKPAMQEIFDKSGGVAIPEIGFLGFGGS